MLIDDGSRQRSYSLLLLSHVDVDEENLRAQAAKYGLEDKVVALLRYLETLGEVDPNTLRTELENADTYIASQAVDSMVDNVKTVRRGDI